MMTVIPLIRPFILTLVTLTSFVATTLAQDVSIPDPGLNTAIREALQKPNGLLTPQDLLGLTNLSAISRKITNLQGLEAAHNLSTLLLDDNHISDFSFPDGLTNLTSLSVLDLSENPLTSLTLPGGLTNLTKLRAEFSALTNLTFPAGLTRLTELRLGANQLPSLTLPADMTNLSILSAYLNQLTNLTLPPNLPNLSELILDGNRLSTLTLPLGLTKLGVLIVGANQLTNFTVPADMTNLSVLRLNDNTIANLTLPPDLTNLSTLLLDGNPFTTFILSEPLAATNLAAIVASLRNQGVSVFTYPVAVQLVSPGRTMIGAFEFSLTGPPGLYSVLASADLVAWSPLGAVTNSLGAIAFTDVTAGLSPQKFYHALQNGPPANMVFIPPNTFTMGSPTNEQDRAADEGPQTTVTLTRGFWMGKYEVTQAEYLSVMNTNPSPFPGDLSRPVSSVSWPDATNYCAKLTQREVAAGRIPAGSHYRLPTEAEWECVARAGRSTRFSYGDDPGYTTLANYAWYASNSGFMPHPVGQKLPNPWGLYDMEGNVVEWCQDWFGLLPGGVRTDPTGPASSSSGRKVTRGGAFDNTQQSCRSAARSLFNAGPFDADTDLGFRVVLVMEPQ